MEKLLYVIQILYDKVKVLSIMLFEREQEIKKLNNIIKVQEDTIQTLQFDVFFSDLELKDIQFIVELSQDVNYMHSLQSQNNELTKTNNVLSRLLNKDILLC